MRIGRVIKWSLLAIVLLLVITAGVVYYMLSRVPEAYHPAELTFQQRRDVAEQTFWDDVSRLNNLIHDGYRDAFRLTESRLNEYLASIDEIAVFQQGTKPGEVHEKMTSMGLAGPAVSLSEETLTLMIRSTEYNKVVSFDLRPQVENGTFSVELLDVRVGTLSLPDSMVQEQLAQLIDSLPAPAEDQQQKPSEKLAVLLRTILWSASRSAGVPANFKWDRREVHLRRVDIKDGALILWLEPTAS
ncbi:MAG: hypothetical protein ACLFUJ_02880 [Phycisphaerae bacterium]